MRSLSEELQHLIRFFTLEQAAASEIEQADSMIPIEASSEQQEEEEHSPPADPIPVAAPTSEPDGNFERF